MSGAAGEIFREPGAARPTDRYRDRVERQGGDDARPARFGREAWLMAFGRSGTATGQRHRFGRTVWTLGLVSVLTAGTAVAAPAGAGRVPATPSGPPGARAGALVPDASATTEAALAVGTEPTDGLGPAGNGSAGYGPSAAPEPAAPSGTQELVPDLSFVPTTATAEEVAAVEALARETVASLTAIWSARLGRPTAVRLWTVHPQAPRLYSACSDSVVNDRFTAFYCPADDTIWVHDLLLIGFARRFGPFATASVLAHEFGHNLRAEVGILIDGLRPVADLELDADCLAGSWGAAVAALRPLTAPEVTGAAEAFRTVGDTSVDARFHHGTPDERMAAWFQGLDGWTCPLGAAA
jgi:predicted metalloprotease